MRHGQGESSGARRRPAKPGIAPPSAVPGGAWTKNIENNPMQSKSEPRLAALLRCIRAVRGMGGADRAALAPSAKAEAIPIVLGATEAIAPAPGCLCQERLAPSSDLDDLDHPLAASGRRAVLARKKY
jgi:hypothetical protein